MHAVCMPLQDLLRGAFLLGSLDHDLLNNKPVSKWVVFMKEQARQAAEKRKADKEAERLRAEEARKRAADAVVAAEEAACSEEEWHQAAQIALQTARGTHWLTFKESVAPITQAATDLLRNAKSQADCELPRWFHYICSWKQGKELPEAWKMRLGSQSCCVVVDCGSLPTLQLDQTLPAELPPVLETVTQAMKTGWDCASLIASCLKKAFSGSVANIANMANISKYIVRYCRYCDILNIPEYTEYTEYMYDRYDTV